MRRASPRPTRSWPWPGGKSGRSRFQSRERIRRRPVPRTRDGSRRKRRQLWCGCIRENPRLSAAAHSGAFTDGGAAAGEEYSGESGESSGIRVARPPDRDWDCRLAGRSGRCFRVAGAGALGAGEGDAEGDRGDVAAGCVSGCPSAPGLPVGVGVRRDIRRDKPAGAPRASAASGRARPTWPGWAFVRSPVLPSARVSGLGGSKAFSARS